MYRFAALVPVIALLTVQAADSGPASDVSAVMPHVDEQTIALVCVDVARMDLEVLDQRVKALAGKDAADLVPFQKLLAPWRDAFTKAGGKTLIVVFSLTDLPMTPPFVLVPLGDGADAKALANLMGPGEPDHPNLFKYEVHEKIGDLVFAGTKAQRQRFADHKPVERPEIARALAAAGDAAMRVVVVPSDDTRRSVEQTAPNLPKELGGGAMTIVTNGARWIAVGVSSPPQASVHLVIQSKDAAAAGDLLNLYDLVAKLVAKEVTASRHPFPDINALVARARPKPEGDRLILDLDDRSLMAILEPVVAGMFRSAARNNDINNLKQIALAMHSYHDSYKTLPARAIFGKDGKPLLSWRVQILPFIEQQNLYNKFHLDEPWDSEHNKKLISIIPAIYRSPRQKGAADRCVYQVAVGPATIFPPDKPVRLRDITDGTSNTILVVETTADHAVIWTKPEDIPDAPERPVTDLIGKHREPFAVAFADGSVRLLPPDIDAKTLHALFTRNGNERVTPP